MEAHARASRGGTPAAGASGEAALRDELSSLKLGALARRAAEMGVADDLVDEADDAAAIVQLIVAAAKVAAQDGDGAAEDGAEDGAEAGQLERTDTFTDTFSALVATWNEEDGAMPSPKVEAADAASLALLMRVLEIDPRDAAAVRELEVEVFSSAASRWVDATIAEVHLADASVDVRFVEPQRGQYFRRGVRVADASVFRCKARPQPAAAGGSLSRALSRTRSRTTSAGSPQLEPTRSRP